MNLVDSYLSKVNHCSKITSIPGKNTGIIIVIPCFNEPCLINTLEALWNCQRATVAAEVIIVINHSTNTQSDIQEQNEKTRKEAKNWIDKHQDPFLAFYLIYEPRLPEKFAGVGLARKIGMDEAVYRFNLIDNLQGLIVGFDADSVCDSNYLSELEKHFGKFPKSPGASIYFEHPIESDLYDPKILEGIVKYELHLRYLNQALRSIGHPHAFHTIGSSFSVKTEAYVKQGGMNKRQAGEDFYFIQKIIALGNYTEINTTRVIPSPRESDRVPFGTGAAIKKWMENGNNEFTTYHFDSFHALKQLFHLQTFFFQTQNYRELTGTLHPAVQSFLEKNDFESNIQLIKNNTHSELSFINRFYNWFNVFKVIKYLNSSHDEYFKQSDVITAVNSLLKNIKPDFYEINNPVELLKYLRIIERKS
jgi:hypothetical protein